MIVFGVVVVSLVWAFLHWRLGRKRVLSGLNAEKPVFSIEPPRRRMGDRRREAL